MRASASDRDQALALLRERCAEGYLSLETFEHRATLLLAARTWGELEACVADVRRAADRPLAPRRWLARLGHERRMRDAVAVALPDARAEPVVVGRSSRCDVQLVEPSVSRRHLELRAIDGGWLAVDLGSFNGTWLLGRRIGRARVAPGDVLALGGATIVLR